MAKRRPAPAMASGSWIICGGYQLDARNSNNEFIFDLEVHGKDGNDYFLRVRDPNDRPGLVQKALRILADRWPAFAWEFQADSDGSITDIR